MSSFTVHLKMAVLILALLVIIPIAAGVQFINPLPDKQNVYRQGDMLDITWTDTPTYNYALVLQHYDANSIDRQAFITYQNASIGPRTNQYVWLINLAAMPANDGENFSYDKPGDQSFKIALWSDIVGTRRLAQTVSFSIQEKDKYHNQQAFTANGSLSLVNGDKICPGFTAGAKAGIGLGVAVGVILITINTAWFLFWMKRKNSSPASIRSPQSLKEQQQRQQQQAAPPPMPLPQFLPLPIPPPPPFLPGPPGGLLQYGIHPAGSQPNLPAAHRDNQATSSGGQQRLEPAELSGNDAFQRPRPSQEQHN
ncbi:hypothetical protein KEM54_002064 [Ascosphaera aggregata]|nr:hypothetical protein KEM54_002064 [Ascosphaera aggregata]